MNPREKRGQAIYTKQDQIERKSDTHYFMKSQSSDGIYDVISLESGWMCSCPDHYYRRVCCKHIHAVEISLGMREVVALFNSGDLTCIGWIEFGQIHDFEQCWMAHTSCADQYMEEAVSYGVFSSGDVHREPIVENVAQICPYFRIKSVHANRNTEFYFKISRGTSHGRERSYDADPLGAPHAVASRLVGSDL